MKLHRLSTAFLATCLLLVCSQGQAEVTVTGDVSPSGATDPWEINSNLFVGNTGEGTLNVEAGGVVSMTLLHSGGYIGYDDDSVGTVTVTGEGSEWINLMDLYVGNYGEGTLNIMAGGVVSNRWSQIGFRSGSVGTVTVTGEGSEWNNSSKLYVGHFGEGTLNIEGYGDAFRATPRIGPDAEYTVR